MTTGQPDVDDTILHNLELVDVQHLCQTNKRINHWCLNDVIIRQRLDKAKDLVRKDYPEPKINYKPLIYYIMLAHQFNIQITPHQKVLQQLLPQYKYDIVTEFYLMYFGGSDYIKIHTVNRTITLKLTEQQLSSFMLHIYYDDLLSL